MTFQVRHENNLFDFIQTRQADKYSKFPNDKSNFYDEIYKTTTSDISNCKYIDSISGNKLSSFKNSLNNAFQYSLFTKKTLIHCIFFCNF